MQAWRRVSVAPEDTLLALLREVHPMILRFLALSALFVVQDPPKPPDQGTPPAKAAPAAEVELKATTLKRVCPDGVTLSGDFYDLPFASEERPTIVCFHMENGSRAEFAKIAPRFGEFSCCTFAIDLRTGKATDGVANETAASAASVLKKPTFTNEEAFADVVQGLKWARELRPTGKLFVLGSGSSAALVIAAAARTPGCADALLLFSPGEDVSGWSIATEAKKIAVPTYITCDGTISEAGRTRPIGNAIGKQFRKMVIPLDVPGAARGWAVLVQSDAALRERHWYSVVAMLLKLAPIPASTPADGPLKKS